MSITYYDPDDENGEGTTTASSARTPRSGRTIGWMLFGGGLAGYFAIQFWQAAQFQFSEPWIHFVMGVGFLLTTSVVTAGIVVISVQRWLLPELARSVACQVARELADPDGAPS